MTSLSDIRSDYDQFQAEHSLGSHPTTLYDAVEYMMTLGGKRLRPMLVLLGYRLWQDHHMPALPAALAVEVFHNFTLAHDDIMDGADIRRGKRSLHLHRDTNSAILAGDVMLIKSYDLLLDACSRDMAKDIMSLMTETALQICEGQQLDMDFEGRDSVSLAEYIEMNTFKTAVLLGTSLKIGALLAGAGTQDANTLYTAGVTLGQAFQIQDDYLDTYGDEEMIGKRRGADIINAKKTFLFAATAEKLTGHRQRLFLELYREQFANPEVKIQKVMQFFDEAGVSEGALAEYERLYKEGSEAIDQLQARSAGKVLLADFVGKLLKREL